MMRIILMPHQINTGQRISGNGIPNAISNTFVIQVELKNGKIAIVKRMGGKCAKDIKLGYGTSESGICKIYQITF